MPDLRLPQSLTQVPFVTALMIKLQWHDHLLHICFFTASIRANDNIIKTKSKTSLNLVFPVSKVFDFTTYESTEQIKSS